MTNTNNPFESRVPNLYRPMGYNNPCCRQTSMSRQTWENAPLAISGSFPDGNGGGILFWAYSIEEANEAYFTFKAWGYRRVTIEAGNTD